MNRNTNKAIVAKKKVSKKIIKQKRSESGRIGGLANAKNFNKESNQLSAFNLYLNENLTQQEIANKLGVSQKTVSNYLKDYQKKPLRPRTRKNKGE